MDLKEIAGKIKLLVGENLTTILIILGIILIVLATVIVNKRKKANISKLKKITLSALFISLHIIVTRYLSYQSEFLRISFETIPLLLAGMILGPKYSVIVGGISDILGATVFATSGAPYFPGFTLSSVLIGCICGVLLYETKENQYGNLKFLLLLICTEAIIFVAITMFLTPLWLSIMFNKAAQFIVWTRLISKAIVVAIEIPVVFGIRLAIKPLLNKYIYEEE